MNNELIDQITVHTNSCVKGFFNEYRWLSNYHVVDIEYKGIIYPSSENAYQAAKTDDEYLKNKIREATPAKSRVIGQEIKKIKNWDNLKYGIMKEILEIKFSSEELKQKLLETGDKFLEETNYWNDVFWGVCKGKGKNNLGIILMEIRETMKCNHDI